jgi:hypothetical protein
MLKTVTAIIATVVAANFLVADISFAASKKKNVRDSMSAEQKKEVRRKARDWCAKKIRNGNSYVDRIEIKSDGRVICWYRG